MSEINITVTTTRGLTLGLVLLASIHYESLCEGVVGMELILDTIEPQAEASSASKGLDEEAKLKTEYKGVEGEQRKGEV